MNASIRLHGNPKNALYFGKSDAMNMKKKAEYWNNKRTTHTQQNTKSREMPEKTCSGLRVIWSIYGAGLRL